MIFSFYFDKIRKFIENNIYNGKSILIHCEEGKNRNVTLSINNLMNLNIQENFIIDNYQKYFS